MIEKLHKNDEVIVLEAVKKDPFQNVYFNIDIVSVGFFGDSIETFVLKDGDGIAAVIYMYYGSIQLFMLRDFPEECASELAVFIESNRIRRTSGCGEIISRIKKYIKTEYAVADGYIMKYSGGDNPITGLCEIASEEDLPEIARLILANDDMGNGYNYQCLFEQLRYRMRNCECINMCIKKDEEVVSHFGVYASTENLAVLSGMITRPEHRHNGYGSMLVKDLTTYVTTRGKVPLIYCFDGIRCYLWYISLGYEEVCTTSKLDIFY